MFKKLRRLHLETAINAMREKKNNCSRYLSADIG